MDFLPKTYFRVAYVILIKKDNSNSKSYWMHVSTEPVDNYEVSADDRFAMTKFSFISNRRKVEKESAFYATNGNILYLFDSDDTAAAYALSCIKCLPDEEEFYRWEEIFRYFS